MVYFDGAGGNELRVKCIKVVDILYTNTMTKVRIADGMSEVGYLLIFVYQD